MCGCGWVYVCVRVWKKIQASGFDPKSLLLHVSLFDTVSECSDFHKVAIFKVDRNNFGLHKLILVLHQKGKGIKRSISFIQLLCTYSFPKLCSLYFTKMHGANSSMGQKICFPILLQNIPRSCMTVKSARRILCKTFKTLEMSTDWNILEFPFACNSLLFLVSFFWLVVNQQKNLETGGSPWLSKSLGKILKRGQVLALNRFDLKRIRIFSSFEGVGKWDTKSWKQFFFHSHSWQLSDCLKFVEAISKLQNFPSFTNCKSISLGLQKKSSTMWKNSAYCDCWTIFCMLPLVRGDLTFEFLPHCFTFNFFKDILPLEHHLVVSCRNFFYDK